MRKIENKVNTEFSLEILIMSHGAFSANENSIMEEIF